MTDQVLAPRYWDSASQAPGRTRRADAQPIVLLHAYPFWGEMWREQRGVFSRERRVIVPDLRGFGATPPAADGVEPSLALLADDVATLLDELGIPSALFAGASMGGYVAMEFLRRYPQRVGSLILSGTRGGADTEEERAVRLNLAHRGEQGATSSELVAGLIPRLYGSTSSARRPQTVRQLRSWALQADPAAIVWAQRAMSRRGESWDVLQAAQLPALVLAGDEDVIAPVAEAANLADALQDSRLVRIADAGHMSNVEDPATFNAAAVEFLSSADVP